MSRQPPKANILIVDDTPENLRLLSAALTQRGYKVRNAINGTVALIGATADPPDLVLLDIKMPDLDGYEVCQRLKTEPITRDIPVIFLSSLTEVFDKVQAFAVGGVDYITKPFQIEEVVARIENQLTIRRLQTSLQIQNERLQVVEAQTRQLNAELEARVAARTTELEAANRQLLYLALHDELTGLPNRALFMEELRKAIAQFTANNNNFAVLFLDCDRFKLINDSFGHLIGDRLLVGVANRLRKCLAGTDTLARLGGDEFTILLNSLTNADAALQTARCIQEQLTQPFNINNHEVFIDVSIGIVFMNETYEKPEHLLRDADTAMYRAKRAGKARYQIFKPTMHAEAMVRLQLETNLRRAISRQEFVVYYQPIVSLTHGRISGFEALIRWQQPERGLIPPDAFIPIAEETGLIVPIGEWVLQEACALAATWQNLEQCLAVSVNLSARQFGQPNLLEQIDRILAQTQLPPQHLKLEITESAILDNTASVQYIFQQLRDRQIKICLDDFGTGYSSLSYLHRFPVDTLKIDRSFVRRIDAEAGNPEIVRAIVTLARQLGMSIIAEGVDTHEQIQQLQQFQCEEAQGYYFFQPLDTAATTELIKANPSLL
jgi:diguanylate cyclase (GGDEF)-like protein